VSLRIHEFSTDSRVGTVLREFIADAEERLELVEKEKRDGSSGTGKAARNDPSRSGTYSYHYIFSSAALAPKSNVADEGE
jgi:hypothetical protein